MITRVLAALAVATAVFAAMDLPHHSGPDAQASSHSAVRSFSAPWALPGGQFEVTVTMSEYGVIGQLVETLPEGFVYLGSDLPDEAVDTDGQTVAFTLLGEIESVTYTVTAPDAEGTYTFSGILKDEDKEEEPVSGATDITIGPAPTPEPTATAVPEPTATPTTSEPTATAVPDPTATAPAASAPTPAPTATAVPVPTATSAPTPAPTATAAPVATATAAPQPTATAVPEPTATAAPQPTATVAPQPTPTPEPEEAGGVSVWVWVLVGLVVAGAVAAAVGIALMRRR